MSSLLNEEIRAIRHTMTHLSMAIPLEQSSGKREKMKQDYKELNKILMEKLQSCEEYKG